MPIKYVIAGTPAESGYICLICIPDWQGCQTKLVSANSAKCARYGRAVVIRALASSL